MTKPVPHLVVRDFDPCSTWVNAVEAVARGCDPKEVAAALNSLISPDDWDELRLEAPVDEGDEPIRYGSPIALLCWAIGKELDQVATWAPKIAPPETGP